MQFVMMRRKLFYALSALVLTACSGSKPSAQANGDDEAASQDTIAAAQEPAEEIPAYNITDALSFGLQGHVERVETQSYAAYESEGELKEGNMKSSSEMTFDQRGNVTRDEWGNEYGYDAEGQYYRGNHVYTVVKRDKAGKITKYVDEEPKTDNEANQTLTFAYDKNGRLTTIEKRGWTEVWTEKRQYKSGNIYPEKISMEGTYEGGGAFTITVTYHYNRFDEKGNWMERTCVISRTDVEEDPDSESGEKSTIEESISIERRSITFYE